MGLEEPKSNRDLRRRAILEVARAVFAEEGYAAASMSSIAARVGGSKATLYNYFRSKEELFAAIVHARCEEEGSVVFNFDLADDDLASTLQRVGEGFLRMIISDETMAMHRVILAEIERFPELGRIFYEGGPRRGIVRLAAFLERAMAERRLRRADADLAAEQFLTLCKVKHHFKRQYTGAPPPTAAEIKAHVALTVDTFLRAYAPISAGR